LVSNGIYRANPIEFNDAWGSGAEWAIAAMDFGETAEGAIEYAKTKDTGTGGRIYIKEVK